MRHIPFPSSKRERHFLIPCAKQMYLSLASSHQEATPSHTLPDIETCLSVPFLVKKKKPPFFFFFFQTYSSLRQTPSLPFFLTQIKIPSLPLFRRESPSILPFERNRKTCPFPVPFWVRDLSFKRKTRSLALRKIPYFHHTSSREAPFLFFKKKKRQSRPRTTQDSLTDRGCFNTKRYLPFLKKDIFFHCWKHSEHVPLPSF